MSDPNLTTAAPQSSARERILFAAHDLFYRDGVRATGVDRVIAAAGVAKLTFYRHFPSKDDLVRAFLAHRHERWMNWFADALARHRAEQTDIERAGDPLAPLLRALEDWLRDPEFRGCAFINVVAELGGAFPETRAIAAAHKQEMTAAIATLLDGRRDAAQAAEAASLAFDGAVVRAQAGGASASAALDGLALALRSIANVKKA